MIKALDKYTTSLKNVLETIKYSFFIKNIRRGTDFIDPWCDFDQMEKILDKVAVNHSNIIKLFYLGKPMDYNELINNVNKNDIENLIEGCILIKDDKIVKTNNLAVLLYQGLTILAEINPWYKTCSNKNTDVYIGFDSLRLAENIAFDKETEVLDLCSGTGIQGMIAAKSAKRVISVEINEKAAQFAKFNIKLNKLENIMEVRIGDLFSVVKDEKFDYIYANPPFIPMLNNVNYPICGAAGEDGLMVLKEIFQDLKNYLKPCGTSCIFCQCIGDKNNIFFNENVKNLAKDNAWDVSCIVTDKIPLRFQAKTLAELTGLFNKDFDENKFYDEMTKIYSNLNAEYLYSILYKVDTKLKRYNFDELKLYNKWSLADKASINSNIDIVKNDDSYSILKDGNRTGYFDNEALEIFNALKEGYNIENIAKILYDKFKNNEKFKRYGLPGLECEILDSCFKMEQLGLIQRN
ncbi:methyltransferase [uncultured Clostridium sp.]|uniref:methyltransferase n=1 Tax=uncultured Clostridium sp. TaxID=59620 RepID=UPI00258A7947|nr:methyltransferase [uncultured Clostridium sp.]MDU1347898.1 methyltransferase [Clostridium argentinense]